MHMLKALFQVYYEQTLKVIMSKHISERAEAYDGLFTGRSLNAKHINQEVTATLKERITPE
jgi:hypothetical protein